MHYHKDDIFYPEKLRDCKGSLLAKFWPSKKESKDNVVFCSEARWLLPLLAQRLEKALKVLESIKSFDLGGGFCSVSANNGCNSPDLAQRFLEEESQMAGIEEK